MKRTLKMMQKPGYPNVSIKLYEDFTAWNENRFIELAATFTTLTLRDSLTGRNEGLLQIYDNKNLHTQLNGDQLIQISLANANSQNTYNRIYGISDFAASVDEKGDNIIGFNLKPLHVVENLKFSRAFFANATESLQEMIRVHYMDKADLAPKVDGVNTFVPRVAWTQNITKYMQYVREIGLAVDSESFVFVWEDFSGIHCMDYEQMIAQEARQFIVGDINQVAEYVQELDTPLAYDFVWDSKTNRQTRNPLFDSTIYSHSFNDKEIQRITRGTGENSVFVSRSGGYSEMTYRNGYEEAIRLCTMSQYDGYASCKTTGDFSLSPGQKIIFGDPKNQFKTNFYVDEVIHEINNNSSVTHIHTFTNGQKLVPIEIEKVKNEIQEMESPSTSVEPEPSGSKTGSDWDLDKLCEVALVRAGGRKSTGDCARYVREALQAAQLKSFFKGGLGHANEMPPRLAAMGWVPVGQNITSFQKGDISTFQRTNTPLGKIYGHVAIWTGSVWVSDFIQPSVQPNRTSNLTYTIYRARYGYRK